MNYVVLAFGSYSGLRLRAALAILTNVRGS